MSFYECLRAYPEGSSSASRMALKAKSLGYRGIVICNAEPCSLFRPEAAERVRGIQVAIGTEVMAKDARSFRSRIASLRARYPLLLVRAQTEEMVRLTAEDPDVDILIPPSARLNQVAMGFDLGPFFSLSGRHRSRWLEGVGRNLLVARKFDLSLMLTAGARSHLDLRSPRDIIALAEVMGFEHQEACRALSLAGRLLDLNRRCWPSPGVELL
jgi:ribonuclease P/MRP protein subunit RPP1